MTKRDVLSVALKTIGVICMLYAIFDISLGLSALSWRSRYREETGFYWLVATIVTATVLLLCMAYVLLKWGDAIANRLIQGDAQLPAVGAGEWEKPVFSLAMRILGAMSIVRTVPSLLTQLARTPFRAFFMPQGWGEVAGFAVILLIGLYLLFGARHLVEFLFREKSQTPA
jgi:hypothetical protein